MLQRLHLVSFLGVKNMGITDIKRELRLYFIQQLAKDELVRSGNMLNPDFYYIPNSEGIGLLADAYREALRNENSQGLDRAIEVAEAFDRSTDVDSFDFKRFYREFIKIEIELLGVLLKREYSDYSEEVKYLYDDETGLSDPAFGSYEADAKPLETLALVTRAVVVANKQSAAGKISGRVRKENVDRGCADFDACALEMLKSGKEHPNTHIATTCKKRTRNAYAHDKLRKRVGDIKKRLSGD
jgi:hypothetical protein